MSAQKNNSSAHTSQNNNNHNNINNNKNCTTSTPAETSRVNALLKSADEGEDFSPVDDTEEDPLRLSISSLDHHNTSASHNNNLEESAEFAEELLSRRLRRKPTRRLSRHDEELNTPTSNNPTSSNAETDQLAMLLSQNCALRGLSSTLLQRLITSEKEARLAWSKYLKLNDSVITDLFAGQLQSTIECMTCHHR